ncbi:uncharacterized protein LOC114535635 [Dendronephthya gigantea]|uniref:uncharacterized protein LOC114535635 n=1 Tax=Dendronephthya gigantea TaxID=151771 RepID=UPI00106AB451|nr:uncharacterized protein LOC114535635 [Dendronephthya gigantea]XP_028412721.1 uncharacterized protein LOC114535635 [Dendronephthya gigantea]
MTTGIQSCLLLWVNLYLVHFSKIEANCAGNGLMNNCACNFIGACTYDVSKNTFNARPGLAGNLRKYIPDVTPLGTPQTTEICEPGNFGIIYDCNNRIPLAATIVMTADQYNDPAYKRPSNKFRQSSEMADPSFQQNDDDYKDALNRKLCYESLTNKVYYIESNWYRAENKISLGLFTVCPNTGPQDDLKTRVHRGHLIAANYGRGTPNLIRSQQTFVYTNAVPQFGVLNSGSWQKHESMLIEWAKSNCGSSPLHVIVGSIPSTYGKNEQRFFGGSGFSDFIGPSNTPGGNGYRVNVPSYLWTAACCHSPSNTFTKSTTFFAENLPTGFSQQSVELSKLFSAMEAYPINLFPGMPSCNDDKNFVSL